jgi:acyl-CoA synthetase (AMP-forming)/AMP-acid ligase II
MQVAPSEIEDTLIEHPDKLIVDVAVAGVSGGRTADEKVPRAWIILSDAGERLGKEAAVRVLDEHVRKTLSKYKHLRYASPIRSITYLLTSRRGGIEVTDAIPKSPTGKVCHLLFVPSRFLMLSQVLRRVLTEQYEAKKQTRAKL